MVDCRHRQNLVLRRFRPLEGFGCLHQLVKLFLEREFGPEVGVCGLEIAQFFSHRKAGQTLVRKIKISSLTERENLQDHRYSIIITHNYVGK